ncbi:MAG TPA: Gmad2 immunoglobulin-like domain-containing protein [Candidatus Paceibacterota bacterium]|jgi:hypothetical protein|nr:Gmad2 immunoglobulin-like domain-containing protein [Candidatus Paceibacterota bacterium]
MSTKVWVTIVIVLAIIIGILAWLLITMPAHAPTAPASQQTTTSAAATTEQPTTVSGPLDTQVVVSAPKANATVSHTFDISGVAPSGWFFEAVFPIQVRDPDDNLIGTTQGRAQGDRTKAGPIAFTAQVTVDASYQGPANLILLKDNPSGLPEEMDSVTVPITVE